MISNIGDFYAATTSPFQEEIQEAAFSYDVPEVGRSLDVGQQPTPSCGFTHS